MNPWAKISKELADSGVHLAPVPCRCGRPATIVLTDGTGPVPIHRHWCADCWTGEDHAMPIVGSRYVPEVHAGGRGEIIAGLAREARSIAGSGWMRMHAKRRELGRIKDELRGLGADMLAGCDGDDGKILIVADHLDGCRVEETGRCDCPPVARFDDPC